MQPENVQRTDETRHKLKMRVKRTNGGAVKGNIIPLNEVDSLLHA